MERKENVGTTNEVSPATGETIARSMDFGVAVCKHVLPLSTAYVLQVTDRRLSQGNDELVS